MGIPASAEAIGQEVARGRAAFGERAYRGAPAESMAAAQLEPWLAGLDGLPQWAIRAAFVKANAGVHPPRPAEVKAIADQACEGLPVTISRVAVAVMECRQKMPEWGK